MASVVWDHGEEKRMLSIEEYEQLKRAAHVRRPQHSPTKRDGRVCIDFDGVIHRYRYGWQGGELYDEPCNEALESLNKLVAAGFEVVIFTTRGGTPEGIQAVAEWIHYWQIKLGLPLHLYEITNVKPPAIAYVDDRAIRFTNWTDVLRYFA